MVPPTSAIKLSIGYAERKNKVLLDSIGPKALEDKMDLLESQA